MSGDKSGSFEDSEDVSQESPATGYRPILSRKGSPSFITTNTRNGQFYNVNLKKKTKKLNLGTKVIQVHNTPFLVVQLWETTKPHVWKWSQYK